tara:strand:- start:79 stop:396 length:318 start_codon:yes stop_codon:yes gene_type:complete
MINKKIILGFFLIILTSACTSPTAMLGPTYTLSSTGNIFQAGFTYGSQKAVENYTGKTPLENLKEISVVEFEDNIQKKTLESEDFYHLVKNKIDKSSRILNLSNQ